MTRAWLAALAGAACVACDVAGPVVDRLPKLPGPELGYVVACRKPPRCEDELRLDSSITEPRPLGFVEALDEDAGLEDELEPSEIAWTEPAIVLTSADPIEVTLDEAPARGSVIELRGPVTLRLENIARLEQVGVASASPDSRLVLDHVTAVELTVGDGENRFAGQLDAKHTAFERASIRVERMDLDSVVFVESFIAADHLASRDVFMEDAVLELGWGLFAPAELRSVDIRRCDELLFYGSSLWNARVPRCAGDAATRFHESKLVFGVFDGSISADTSKLEAVRLGQRQPTSIVAWGTAFTRVNFCDLVDDVMVERRGVVCSDCSEGAFEDALCTLPQSSRMPPSSTGRYNFCLALDEAGWCAEPLPDRARPHTNDD